ncbi:MAG TPA: polymer-forming cytoskeletal protein [Gammaproteobacteria bacterium]|nr:polymer-forming cytoskeletal protein [Gammaproteobacteria bacterium]
MFDMNNLKRNTTKREPSEEVPSSTAPAAPAEPRAASPVKEPATIGASIHFKGDLSGEEDFVIQGKVEGTINLEKNNLTIGKNGRIRANVTANTIIIEGQLQGDMFGNEKVIIRKSGNVLGNIVAPRVTLEDGAKFKGSIEMEPKAGEAFGGGGKKSEAESRGTGTGAGGTPGTPDFKGAQQ